MPKGVVPESREATEATLLRQQIRELEIRVANIRGMGEGVFDLLRLRSQVEDLVQEREASGLDVRAERTRLRTVDNMLTSKAGQVVREAGLAGGLAQARRTENPSESHWWWFLDEIHNERQRRTAIRLSLTIIGAAVAVLIFSLVMNRFFGLDPKEKEAYSHAMNGEQLLARGEYEAAAAEYEQAVNIAPDRGEYFVYLGVIYELLGRSEDGEKALNAGQDLIGDRFKYLLVVARVYETTSQFEKALQAVEEALQLNENSAEAYLVRGGVYESMGKRQEAISDFEKAADLASEQGEDALYVLAKTRLGMLMQQAPDSFGPPGTGF